jgi:lysozyme
MGAQAIDLAVQMLTVDEGCELSAYPDPGSVLGTACEAAGLPMRNYQEIAGWQSMSGDPWTIGYGQTGDGIRQGVTWTLDQADAALTAAVTALDGRLSASLVEYASLNAVRQAVLINMAYNIGFHGLLAFRRMLGYLSQGNMSGAASELLDSDAARQLPTRYQRLAKRLESGAMTT